MKYFIPKSGRIAVGNGRTVPVLRGIHEVDHAIADSHAAIAYGIKPVEEMTDAEWTSVAMKKPEAKAKSTLDGAVRTVTP